MSSRRTGPDTATKAPGSRAGTRTGRAAAGTEPLRAPSSLAAFEALHARCYADLVQQTFLLTARRRRAARAVRQAFGTAWNRWADVCASTDPEGWVRALAFDAALSPWHRVGPPRTRAVRLPRRRIRVAPPDEPGSALRAEQTDSRLSARDRALLRALLRLSRPRRRALVLHDALGLPFAEIAAEVDSSTASAEGRVRAARAALARSVPDLVGADPDAPGFGERLGGLMYQAGAHGCPVCPRPTTALIRVAGRLRAVALPGAAGLLVLATLVAFGSTLAGSGPSTAFEPRPPQPVPLCTAVGTGSAGPAAPAGAAGATSPLGAPGIRSPWCGPTPGQPAILVARPAYVTAPGAADTEAPGAEDSDQPVISGDAVLSGHHVHGLRPAPLPVPVPVAVPWPATGPVTCPTWSPRPGCPVAHRSPRSLGGSPATRAAG